MSFSIEKASRRRVKLKIGLTGASGSGKTMSSLRLAYGLCGNWEKICVIDTEQRSSELYSSLGPFNILNLTAPFNPSRYVEAIRYAEKSGMEVIIVDSASHEWDGPGGCLELHERAGGQFQSWKQVTPLHRKFLDAIVTSPCHILCTLRAKADYSMEKDESSGKSKVAKHGLKATQREGFDYEVSIEFRLNANKHAIAAKDRTGLFSDDEIPFLITEETGKKLRLWNESGADFKPLPASQEPAMETGTPDGSVTESRIITRVSNEDYVIPFGKFKDARLKDVPPKQLVGYVQWLQTQPQDDRKPQTRQAKELIERVSELLDAEGGQDG